MHMKLKKRYSTAIFILIDIMIAIFSTIMPFVFRFGIFSFNTGIAERFFLVAMKWLPLDILIFMAVNTVLRLYNRVWTYASVGEMYDCAKAAVITEAIYMAYKMLLGINMFRSYYPFNFLIMGMLLGLSRISIRVIRGIEKRKNKKGDTRNVMIIGGGAAATMLIKEYQLSNRRINVCCIIDDNPTSRS